MVGALGLARLDIRIALELLIARLPGLRLVPDQDKTLNPGFNFCTPQRLEFEWDVDGGVTSATATRP